ALFFHVECTDPWVTEAPAASAIAPAVLPASEHVMEYHVVLEGGCWAGLIGEQQIRLEQGDIFVLPHGDAHVLSSKPGMRASAAMDFLFTRDRPQLPFLLQQGGAAGGAQTTLLCGFLGCD